MSLNPTLMKTTIKDKLKAQFGDPTDDSQLDKYAQGMAEALIEILTNQATVTVTNVASGGNTAPGVIS